MRDPVLVDQLVRAALVRLQAIEGGRPVSIARLARELPGLTIREVEMGVHDLVQRKLAEAKADGFVVTSRPLGSRALDVFATHSRLHR